MDILLLEKIVDVLRGPLVGARIGKIHQPTADTLIFRLWNGRDNLRLLISVGQYPRMHLTQASYPNPFTPMRFCQLLRARLTRLVSLERISGERIACLRFDGPQGPTSLYAELFGRQGNLILVSAEGRIIDCLIRKPESAEGRALLAGQSYRLPPPLARIPLLDCSITIPAEIGCGANLQAWLLKQLSPMSPAQARFLAWQAEQSGDAATVLEEFRQRWLNGHCQPRLLEVAGEELLVPCPSEFVPSTDSPESLSVLLDKRFFPLQFQEGRIADRRELLRVLAKQRKRLRNRLANIAREGEGKAAFLEGRRLGELLLANLHRVNKGMDSVTVTDYTQDPLVEVQVPLDPRLSPQENASSLFNRYKKDRRAFDHIHRRSAETRVELEWLEQLQHNLDEAETTEDLFEVGEELKQAGLYRAPASEPSSRKKIPATPTLHQATSPHGFRILWGRNNRANDYLSTRVAAAHDYWFHVHRQPGCHLLLKRDGPTVEVPDEDLRFAAALAAGYSRARHEQSAEVVWCQAREVYKVKGARPGQVNLRRHETLRVAPRRLEEPASSE